MNDIDEIMKMLDINNNIETQKIGIALAKRIKNIKAFIYPIHNKNVLENCAKILSYKTDEELNPYLNEMFEWMVNSTLPGTETILRRLKLFYNLDCIIDIIEKYVKIAKLQNNEKSLKQIATLLDNENIRVGVSKEILELLSKYAERRYGENTIHSIDEIMEMLDWNNSNEIQEKGIELAKNVKTINLFILPLDRNCNKNVWENCARILSDKTDQELTPYIIKLLEWTEDLNWPGALIILDRLKQFSDVEALKDAIEEYLNMKTATREKTSLSTITEILENKNLKD